MPDRKARRPERQSATSSRNIMVQTYQGGVLETEDVVLEERDIEMFETEPAYVRVGAGVTKKLADYESLRIDVSITMPCYKELVEQTFTAVAESVSVLLEEEVENYLGSGKE